MDALPSGLRMKVLDAVEVDDEGHVTRVSKDGKAPGKVKWYMFPLWMAAFWFAFPFVIVGAIVCLSLVFIPVGMAIIVVGCYPIKAVTQRMVIQKHG
jgi:hypothetical protein